VDATDVTPPAVAVMLDVPVVTAVASPLVGEVFEMVTTELAEEVQVQVDVTTPVVPSEYVAVAENCTVGTVDKDRVCMVGEMLTPVIVLLATVTLVDPITLPLLA
jgi:hypothetical protein